AKLCYFGERIACVIAVEDFQAAHAASLIKVEYESLPVVNTPSEAVERDAIRLHENLANYTAYVKGVHAVPGTNIANLIKIRKGDMEAGWDETDTTIDASVSFSPADHAALETRSSQDRKRVV